MLIVLILAVVALLLLLIASIFRPSIGHYAVGHVWLRFLVLVDIAKRKSGFRDLVNPTMFREFRIATAESLLREFIDSPLVRAFAAEHEGEGGCFVVELWDVGSGFYCLDLVRREIRCVNGRFDLKHNPVDAVEEMFEHRSECDPITCVRASIFRAKLIMG